MWEEKKDKFYVKKRGEKQIISCLLFQGKTILQSPREKNKFMEFSPGKLPFRKLPLFNLT